MHTIEPARLKQGVEPDSMPDQHDASPDERPTRLITGRALIFWDPMSLPGTKFAKKRDAIDTDQITPAADCVSESLETLDEKWKAGSFRHLMPDFRERVHRGHNFIIAGDRFAIGSSREMSPAGLKGVAEEAGLEMVVVCGQNMGDIFRRNSFNLGLHVVQSPEAVTDAQDGDVFSFDPVTRRLTNETRQRTYDPVPLSEKEEEIRRSGGIFAVGRRDFKASVVAPPSVDWADERVARGMTTTEQIVWAHRVDKHLRPHDLKPGTTLRVYADLLPASDGTAPFAIHTFNQITGGNTIYPRQAAIANDHFVFTGVEADDKQTGIGRQFAELHGIKKPYYATPGDGIFHFYFPEQGLVMPGQFIPGADSHSRAYGAYGAVGIGVGSTTLGFRMVDRVHLLHARATAPGRVHRPAPAVGRRQGHRARTPETMGREAGAGDVGRARRRGSSAADCLPQHDRQHDGGSRGAQRHLCSRRCDLRVVSTEGRRRFAVPAHDARCRGRTSTSTRGSILPTSRR